MVAGRESHRRRYGSSVQRSISASSSSSSVPCGRDPRHAGPASSPNASASTTGSSLAGRSSGANTFPRHISGRPHGPIRCRLSRSSACHARSWMPSSPAITAAGAGPSSCGFSHRLRSPGPCESRFRDDCFQPAEDAVAHVFQPGYRERHGSFPYFARRCDDSNTPQFHRCLMGAISVLRSGIALELSPCAERSSQRSAPLPRRPGPIL